jgi:exonuclease III
MSESKSALAELRVYSHNIEGLTPDKEDDLRSLADQRDLDIIFLQETFNGIPDSKTDASKPLMYSKAGFSFLEYVNANKRRGIQFRVRRHLEPLLLDTYCRHTFEAEILTIIVNDIIFIGAYLPDGKKKTGLEVLLQVVHDLEARYPDHSLVLVGDLNSRARLLGNTVTNPAGDLLDAWMEDEHNPWACFEPPNPTFSRLGRSSFLDVVLVTGPIAMTGKCEQLQGISSSHTSFLATFSWRPNEVLPSIPAPRINTKHLNRFLMNLVEQQGEFSLSDLYDYLQSQASKTLSRHHYQVKKPPCHWFVKSGALKRLGRKVMSAKKDGDKDEYVRLRSEYRKQFRKEKSASFKEHIDLAANSKDLKQFCSVLRRTNPKSTWKVNTGHMREEYIAEDLINVQMSRPDLLEFVEGERRALESEACTPDPHLITEAELKWMIQSRANHKSPGPSGLSYDNLKALNPSLYGHLAKALSLAVSSHGLHTDWLHLYIKPLSKKPGKPEIRPISLMESLVKIVDGIYLQRLQQVISDHNLLASDQFGFRRRHSAQDQLIRLTDFVQRQKGKATVLLSVDLKGAYDRISNKILYERLKCFEELKPWKYFLFHMLFTRRFKVRSQSGICSKSYPLYEGIPQGSPSAPTLFNVFIDPALQKIRSVCEAQFPYADDNTIAFVKKPYEDKAAFLSRVCHRIEKIRQIYSESFATMSLEKCALLSFHLHNKVKSLAGIDFKMHHRILGIQVGRNLNFQQNTEVVVLKCRRLLSWLNIYSRRLSIGQRRLAYQLFIQSLLDYHIMPTWIHLNQSQRLRISRITYRGARMILRAPHTVDGDICCREALIFSAQNRFIWCAVHRAQSIQPCMVSDHGAWTAWKRLVTSLGFASVLSETGYIFKAQIEVLKKDLYQRQWSIYAKKFPERAKFLAHPGSLKLRKSTKMAFLIRTRQVKTKEWRRKHGQPLALASDEISCRFCASAEETIEHLLLHCPAPIVATQQALMRQRRHQLGLNDEPNLEEILTRHKDPKRSVLQDKLLSDFFEPLKL